MVGTSAFADLSDIKAKLVERMRLRIEAMVLDHPDGRVLVFEVPSRPIGMPIACDGAYWMRARIWSRDPDPLRGSSMRPVATTG